MKAYCLDTFAVIAYLRDEKSASKVLELLKEAQSKRALLFMHGVNLGELYYTVAREEGEEEADIIYGRVIDFPINFIYDLKGDMLITAARIKSKYRLSYADSFSAAAAILKNAILITGDQEFKPLEKEGIIKLLWLEK